MYDPHNFAAHTPHERHVASGMCVVCMRVGHGNETLSRDNVVDFWVPRNPDCVAHRSSPSLSWGLKALEDCARCPNSRLEGHHQDVAEEEKFLRRHRLIPPPPCDCRAQFVKSTVEGHWQWGLQGRSSRAFRASVAVGRSSGLTARSRSST
mgnify:CR=1 FL=1